MSLSLRKISAILRRERFRTLNRIRRAGDRNCRFPCKSCYTIQTNNERFRQHKNLIIVSIPVRVKAKRKLYFMQFSCSRDCPRMRKEFLSHRNGILMENFLRSDVKLSVYSFATYNVYNRGCRALFYTVTHGAICK